MPSRVLYGWNLKPARRRLNALSLVYGQRAVRMDYDRALFGMRLAACRALSQALPLSTSLPDTLCLHIGILACGWLHDAHALAGDASTI